MFRRLINAFVSRAKLLATLPIRRQLGRQVQALDAAGFAFLSNNCLAGQLYDMADRQKSSPTAGLYFVGEAYPRFLEDLANGKSASWSHIEPAKLVVHKSQLCPVLKTGEGSGIVFLHYPNPYVAAQKWNDRFSRLTGRELIVIASLRDGLDRPMLDSAATHFRHMFVAGPALAPPADEFVLDREWLKRLSHFLDNVLLATYR